MVGCVEDCWMAGAMTGQLSLILTPPDVERVPWPASRRLPLLRNHLRLVEHEAPTRPVEAPSGRRVSRVCQPGYHRGRRPGNAGRRYPAEPLTADEMQRLLDATGRGYAGARDRGLYTVLWRTGLRIAESLALLPKDIDFESGTITVLHGKGDKRRVVGVDDVTLAEVAAWMDKREELGVRRDEPVFCVISKPTVGKSLYASCVREQLRDCARRAGIEKRVHPHGMRHTFASELANENVPIHVIGALLGHSNPATTAHYINHLAPGQAIEVARARVWVRGEFVGGNNYDRAAKLSKRVTLSEDRLRELEDAERRLREFQEAQAA